MIDPGVIAAVIFGGIPTATIGWFGGTRAVRGVVGWHRARHLAQLEAKTPWRAYKEIADGGEYVIALVRKAGAYGEIHTYAHNVWRRLPPETSRLDADVALWEAIGIATETNEREGRGR